MKTVTSEAQYKQYFSGSFQGMTSLIVDVLSPIFGKFTPTTDPRGVDYVDVYGNEGANIDHIYDYGKFYTDNTDVSVFEVVLSERCHISRARKGIRKAVGRITEKYSGAFIVFHYPEGSANAEAQTWRLSWLKRLDVHRDDSPAKRYTYLCGPDYSCRTIAQRFETLYKEKNKTLDSISKAFDAEALSEEFFKEYKVLYDDIVQWITGQRVIREGRQWKEEGSFRSGNGKDICDDFLKEFENIESQEEKEKQASKAIRDYVKKMLGRLVFIQFLQKKGYLGIDGKTTQNFLLDLFNCITDEQKDNFIDTALEQVVYLLLNSDDRKPGSEVINNHTLEVPFLNGGLFERDKWDEKNVKLPKEFFHNEQYVDEKRDFRDTELRPNDRFLTQCGILDLFNHYNFTIDENDPNDAEVGVDPEMLGKIFENLLEDNKEKGAFYTPKEIVQYMCKESLIAYLCTKVTGHDDDIRAFVDNPENGNVPEKDKVLDALKNVKICDPAIGSGAFPMGLLNLLVALREKLEPSKNRCDLKKDIIQNNIYGVDIEKGAIDIARLRFWLSIMVDEDVDEKNPQPTPLPNFDYKFMQGNSLVESYAGHDLSHILDNNETSSSTSKPKKFNPNQTGMNFSSDDTRQNLQIWLSKYFSLSDHNDKDEYRKQINNSVKSYIEQQGISTSEENHLKDIDPSATTEFFLWHTWFKDVFDHEKFDIVIGNPPFVNVQLMSDSEKQLYRKTYTSFFKRCDMFCLFLELGLKKLSSDKGIVTLIIPSVVHSNMSYQKIRGIILNGQWLQEVHYTGGNVFNAPTVDTTILVCNKGGNEQITLTNAVDFKHPKSHKVPADYFSKYNNVISIGDDQGSEIFDKLFSSKFDIVGQHYNVFQGIVTGNNPAFIFDTEKDALENSIDSSLLHPLCHGRDVEKYKVRSRERRIIYIDNNVNIDDYPRTKEWLLDFKEALDTRREVRRGVINWYCLQWPRVKAELDIKEKILIQNTRNEALKTRIVATLDNCNVYGTQGVNFIIPKHSEDSLRYLLGILNSKLINYLFATKFLNLAIKAEYVKQLRVPTVNDKQKKQIESLVNQMLEGKQIDCDTSYIESKIDCLVFHLYDLTYDEVLIIYENEKPPFSREQYENENE